MSLSYLCCAVWLLEMSYLLLYRVYRERREERAHCPVIRVPLPSEGKCSLCSLEKVSRWKSCRKKWKEKMKKWEAILTDLTLLSAYCLWQRLLTQRSCLCSSQKYSLCVCVAVFCLFLPDIPCNLVLQCLMGETLWSCVSDGEKCDTMWNVSGRLVWRLVTEASCRRPREAWQYLTSTREIKPVRGMECRGGWRGSAALRGWCLWRLGWYI